MRRGTIEVKDLPIRCPACDELVTVLDMKHAKSHGYSRLKDFKEAFGIKQATRLQRSREKLKALYNMDHERWAVVYWDAAGDWKYVTKQYRRDFEDAKAKGLKSACKFPLSDGDIHRHLSGANPLAIFAKGTHARYFGFDVDSGELAPIHTLKLIYTLEQEGIERKDIHISISGGKGMHVELFVDKHIDFATWTLFGEYIKAQAGLIDQPIELRPNEYNGHAWKLPLTVHHKTGRFAAFCNNQTLESYDVIASHDYLDQIEPMSAHKLWPILQKAQKHQAQTESIKNEAKEKKAESERQQKQAIKIVDERLFQTDDEKRQRAISFMEDGLVRIGTRFNATRLIAHYLYREVGWPIEDIREFLISWTETQIMREVAATPLDHCIADIDSMMEWLPRSSQFGAVIREITITAAEIDWIARIPNPHARDLLWALLLRSKVYAKKDGTFYTADRDLQKLLCKPRQMSRRTISVSRKWLVERDYIDATIPKSFNPKQRNHEATTYKLKFEAPEDSNIIDTVHFDDDMDARELLKTIASRLYSGSWLKLMGLAS